MKVKRVELSPEKRKALRIILKEGEKGIEEICREMAVTKATIFYKLNGKRKFKEKEYTEILEILGITDEELEKCADSYILKFLSRKECSSGII